MASSEYLVFRSFASMGDGINTVFEGGGRWMGFIKSGIGVVVVFSFFFLFFLFFFF